MKDLHQLPDDLPVPEDDGACDHLKGKMFPSLLLKTNADRSLDLSAERGVVVIFFYPMIGKPGSAPMIGWNEIPGARGCTPQACSYRDNYHRLTEIGVTVFGASSQSLVDQKESVSRLNLPYELLNDSAFKLTDKLNLPTFGYQKTKMIKRLTLISINGTICKVFYPVFPPDQNVNKVLSWLKNNIV